MGRKTSLTIPEDFRLFVQEVVELLDSEEEDRFLHADDALQAECGYGGLDPATGLFTFCYFDDDSDMVWTLQMPERTLRDIADGHLEQVTGQRQSSQHTRRKRPRRDALLVWGQGPADFFAITQEGELAALLDALHIEAQTRGPRSFYLWSRLDDLLVGSLARGRCALEVVRAGGHFGSTRIGGTQEELRVPMPDGNYRLLPWSAFLPWAAAREAVLLFVECGELEQDLPWVPQVDSRLRGFALLGRQSRAVESPTDLRQTSLAGSFAQILSQQDGADTGVAEGRWPMRLLRLCIDRGLLQLTDDADVEKVADCFADLLEDFQKNSSLDSLEVVEEVANELTEQEGIEDVYATREELAEAIADSLLD